MTNVIRSPEMAEKAISVRLDEETQRALRFLMRDGATRSDAIRSAVLAASREARLARMEADARRLGSDPHDRALVAEIAEFFGEVDLPPR